MEKRILFLDELGDANEETVKDYGLKALGLSTLKKTKTRGKLAEVHVPNGFVIPKGARNNAIETPLRKLLGNSPTQAPKPLMIRSSAEDEEPGKYLTMHSIWNPAEPEISYARLMAAINRVVAQEPKAVIIQNAAMGQAWAASQWVWGVEDRSFVVHSHSPMNSRLTEIAVVQGLATEVVNEGHKPIIDVDRGSGAIKMVLYLSDAAYERGRKINNRYRQASAAFLTGNGEISFQEGDFPENWSWVFGGEYDDYLEGYPQSPFISRRFQPNGNELENIEGEDVELSRVMMVTRKLLEIYGRPFELEGNFTDGNRGRYNMGAKPGRLNVFQIRDLEKLPKNGKALEKIDPQRIIAKSTCVMGTGKFIGPLIVDVNSSEDSKRKIFELDKKYGKGHYMLLTPAHYGAGFWGKIENCSVRLSMRPEHMQSHNMGLVRGKIARGEKIIYAGLNLKDSAFYHPEDDEMGFEKPELIKLLENYPPSLYINDGEVYVFDRIGFESNGEECQLYIPKE